MKTSVFKVPRVSEDLAHLQPSTAAPRYRVAISAARLHPRSLPCPWSGLNNRHRCRNYDFISFNIVGLKCFKVGQIGKKRGIWVRVNELCRLDICLNYLLSLWYLSYAVISNLNVLRGSFITSDIAYVKRKIKLLLVRPGLCNVCSKGIFIPSLLQMHKLCSWLDVKWFLFSERLKHSNVR